jgi:hypothetical protein
VCAKCFGKETVEETQILWESILFTFLGKFASTIPIRIELEKSPEKMGLHQNIERFSRFHTFGSFRGEDAESPPTHLVILEGLPIEFLIATLSHFAGHVFLQFLVR